MTKSELSNTNTEILVKYQQTHTHTKVKPE